MSGPAESPEEAESNQSILEEAANSHPIVVSQSVLVGKLEGGYEAGIKMMLRKTKIKRKIDDFIGNKEELIIIDSYNGVEHSKNHKSKTSLISFSSQLFNKKIIRELGYSTASPNNILTWMQLRGPEKPQNVLPVSTEVYKEIKTIQEYLDNIVKEELDGKRFSIYEVSDGKMLYMLLQHSLYSRLHKPYFLYTCLRGEGVRDKSH